MSVEEILAELPKLEPAELERVFQQALELHEKITYTASPELAKAIEEALAEPEENSIPIDEAYRMLKSWNSK